MVPPSTYVEFLLVFLGPALAMLAALVALGGPARRRDVRPFAVGVVVALALAYTIPWDNYLIARGVWWYGDGTVAHTVWNAPIEEYAFIVLQPLLTALWVRLLATVDLSESSVASLALGWRTRLVGLLGALAVGALGVGLFVGTSTLYLGAILAWAAPVLGLQWAFGWPQLWRRRRTVLLAVAVPTAYLCVADWVAINLGIWQLSAAYTTGYALLGLPIEEALFFLVTNVFVVQGLVLYAWLLERCDVPVRRDVADPARWADQWSNAVSRLVGRQ
jgi:lycopene cyclase domain-containing protein